MFRSSIVACLALTILGVSPAFSRQSELWQGVALRNDGRFGMTFVSNERSEAAARAKLRDQCAENGWPCTITGVVTRCLAVAYNEADLSFATAAGDTQDEARRSAYALCREEGYDCDTEHLLCPRPARREATPTPTPARRTSPLNVFVARGVLAARGTPSGDSDSGIQGGRMFADFTAATGQPETRLFYEDCQNVDCQGVEFTQQIAALTPGGCLDMWNQPVDRPMRTVSASTLSDWNRSARLHLRIDDGCVVAAMGWRSGGTETFARAVDIWAAEASRAARWLEPFGRR